MSDKFPPTCWRPWVGSQWPLRFELRDISFLLLVVANILWFWEPLALVFTSSLQGEHAQHYSHIVLVPLLCLHLLYLRRSAIFATVEWNPFLGSILIMIGGAVSLGTKESTGESLDGFLHAILSFVMTSWGAFLFCYGIQAVRTASFGLGLLAFMVPYPSFVLDAIVGFLQRYSADTVEVLFSTLGIQAIREGFTFELSNIIILVEEACSGIRSFFALVITSLVAGYWFLSSGWARAALVAAVVPLAIIKNASRIVGLTLLANDIDPAFLLNSVLHRSGGIPLFLLSFAVLTIIAWLLRKVERWFECAPHDGLRSRA